MSTSSSWGLLLELLEEMNKRKTIGKKRAWWMFILINWALCSRTLLTRFFERLENRINYIEYWLGKRDDNEVTTMSNEERWQNCWHGNTREENKKSSTKNGKNAVAQFMCGHRFLSSEIVVITKIIRVYSWIEVDIVVQINTVSLVRPLPHLLLDCVKCRNTFNIVLNAI